MANIEKLKFPALKITGANYIAWTTDVELYFESQELSETLKLENLSPPKDKAKAIIFLRKHLDENVTHDYAHIKDPAELWQALKARFHNQREITLPHALEDWKNLRFQDFEKVEEYNSAMLRIVSQLKYCGKPITEAEMLEKTYLTFHKEHCVLQEMYRNCGYKRFSELIVTLILAEKNNELLLKNHNSRPTGAKAFHEVNATDVKNPERGSQTYRGRGRRFNRGRGRSFNPQSRKSYTWVRPDQSSKGKESQGRNAQKRESICYRCGSKGHWAHVCRTPEHLCKLYKESQKGKGKEVNLTEHFEGTSYLEASDFINDVDETAHADN
ncbi:Zinc finger CCHC-type [Arabidopsis thaliana x Arabidopsis arenosa]|uniref:Zinc finger CCHC-type n=1 Tax=Arabidopsis thaliana x Arabidopsis arenosa TaxID=1240361 RepID=A0A8T2AVU1_9BRAS|nr:Zinc finger CCHC-type [Arabidopsis thaliana x Arabidopsis arenosa]